MVIQSGFWHLASVALLFWLAKEITNLEAAVLSTLFFASDPVVLLYSYGGMTESLATFLLLLFFIIIISERLKAWRWPLLGAISILAYLARTQLILLAPLALVFAWTKAPKGKRVSAILLILAGMSLPLIPWSLRNLQMAGDPLFSFTTTRNLVLDAVPGHSDLEMQLYAPADLFSVADLYGSAILTKFLSNVAANIFSPLYWANSFRRMLIFLPLFAFVSLLRLSSSSGEKYRFLVWTTLALILATFLLISLTVYSVRSYVMFRPLIIMIGINEIIALIRRTFASRTIRIGISTLLLLLAGYMLVSAASDHRDIPAPLSQFDQKAYDILNGRTEEGSLIGSDISEQVSLFTGRRTLRLPAEPAELLEIDMEYIQVDYVLLSRDLMIGSYAEDNDPGYHETYQNYEEFSRMPEFLDVYFLDERLPNGSLLFRRKQ
jgi:4-amino-4-deoxy-L-arabinose transferase-like glycosyltransferase